MKLLIDENLPRRIKTDLIKHEVFTVRDMLWQGKKNGDLLKSMIDKGFEGLITFDKNLRYQQNFKKYPITVFIINTDNNTYLSIKKAVTNLLQLIDAGAVSGPVEVKAD